MRLLPPSTNADYHGAKVSAWALTGFALMTIIPGCIHMFLPDGGMNVIAGRGVDLESTDGRRAVALFAWAGATQIVWGIIMLLISLRYRTLTALALGLIAFERTLHLWHMWGPKSAGSDHHPPEAYATLVMIPVATFFCVLAMRERKP